MLLLKALLWLVVVALPGGLLLAPALVALHRRRPLPQKVAAARESRRGAATGAGARR